MSNTISIKELKQKNYPFIKNIENLSEDLVLELDIQIDIDNFLSAKTYDELVSSYYMYDTYRKAQHKGYEAHHIIPVCDQIKRLKEEKGINLTRAEFCKTEYINDKCIRLTTFEHIYIHYVYAVCNNNFTGLLSIIAKENNFKSKDLITIKELIDWAQAKKEAYKAFSTPEIREKNSKSKKAFFENMTDMAYKSWCAHQKEIHNTDSARKNMSDGRKRMFANMTIEEKQAYKDYCKEVANRPEVLANTRQKTLEYYANLAIEEYHKRTKSDKLKHQTPEVRQHMRDGQLRYLASLTIEQKEARRQRSKEVAKNSIVHKWRTLFLQDSLGLTWNEYQKAQKEAMLKFCEIQYEEVKKTEKITLSNFIKRVKQTSKDYNFIKQLKSSLY